MIFIISLKNHPDHYIKEYSIVFIFTILTIVILYQMYSLQEIKLSQLKNKRKADLYLIYQLFQPFQKFLIHSQNFRTYSIVHQFFQFEFKEEFFQIGGDFIYLKEIYLRNRKFLFFINADAMGKSLLGFGGIIVLSSVLSAILKRTETIKTEQKRYPDTWLKYISMDIQEVLGGFEGFMMISCVIGLIDEENGFTYFINFDHPKPLQIRSNKEFNFLEYNNHNKLGFPSKIQTLQINRTYLQNQESFVAYSDGCIEIEMNEKINENETLIIELLSKTSEDLSDFLSNLQKKGIIKDDISLLKIVYNKIPELTFIKDNKEIKIPFNESMFLEIKKTILNLLKGKKYSEIVYNYGNWINDFPYDDDLLYILSVAYRKMKEYNLSIEIGERLLNFNMHYNKNYSNLIFCYLKNLNISRVDTLLAEFKKHFPKQSVVFENKIKKFFKKIHINE